MYNEKSEKKIFLKGMRRSSNFSFIKRKMEKRLNLYLDWSRIRSFFKISVTSKTLIETKYFSNKCVH